MKLKSTIKHFGRVKIIVKEKNQIVHEEIINNAIMNDSLDMMIGGLNGDTVDMQMAYVALGDDNTAISSTQTTLVSETFRSAVVGRTKTDVGQLSSEFLIGETEGNGQIEEIGFFGGSLASGTTDSGLMIARVLWSYLKTSGQEIFIQRIDTLV